MTINEIMSIGTTGMNAKQKVEEQERRLKVCEKINTIGEKIKVCMLAGNKVKVRYYNKELSRIKGDERVWLKEAAWFMYC